MLDSGDLPRVKAASLWKLITSRWKTAVLVTSLSFAAACVVIRGLAPVYTASVQMVLPYTALEDPSGRKGLPQSQTDMFVVRGFADIFQSDGLCLTVINKLGLERLPEFQPRPSLVAAAFARWTGDSKPAKLPVSAADVRQGQTLHMYKARLKARNDNKSLILDVSFEASDPYLAARVIDAHVAAFLDAQVAYRQHEAAIKTAWIKSEMDSAAAQMRTAQSSVQLQYQHPGFSVEAAAGDAAELRFRQILAQSRQTVYQTLLAQYQEMLAEQQYIGSDIRVLSKAVIPIHPSFPRPILFGAIAAVASLLLGLMTATVVVLLSHRKSIEDAAVEHDLKVLGRLHVRTRRLRLRGSSKSFRLAEFWEDIRGIRSAIDLRENSGHTILITSSISREGKSLTAASLARSIAASGLRTMLLDMNFRKPSFYAPPNAALDLRDYFESDLPAPSLTIPLDASIPLYFLGMCRERAYGKLDVFGSPKMTSLIAGLKRDFDAIVIDAPALERVADALFIADQTDETILVSMEGRTTEASLARSVLALSRRSAPLSGIVISDRHTSRPRNIRRLKLFGDRHGWMDVWPSRIPELVPGAQVKPLGVASPSVAFARTMAKRLP